MSEKLLNISDKVMSSVTKLVYLVNSDKQQAEDAIQRFKELLDEHIAEFGEDALYEIDGDDSDCVEYLDDSLAAYLSDADIGNCFTVDWKDTESAIDWLNSALEYEGIEIDLQYGVDDPINELSVYQIMVRSNHQLKTIGYSLLGFCTGEDAYSEILLPSDTAEQFIQIAKEIQVTMDRNLIEETN